MSRRKEALDALFECYVKEGRVLGPLEAKRLYPVEISKINKVCTGNDMRRLFNRMKKIYADRWHEIYDKNVNIVHEKPQKVSDEKPEKVSEPILSPLDKLKMASRKVNE